MSKSKDPKKRVQKKSSKETSSVNDNFMEDLVCTSLGDMLKISASEDGPAAAKLLDRLAEDLRWICIRKMPDPTPTQMAATNFLSCCENMSDARRKKCLVAGTIKDGPHPKDQAEALSLHLSSSFGLKCHLVPATNEERDVWMNSDE